MKAIQRDHGCPLFSLRFVDVEESLTRLFELLVEPSSGQHGSVGLILVVFQPMQQASIPVSSQSQPSHCGLLAFPDPKDAVAERRGYSGTEKCRVRVVFRGDSSFASVLHVREVLFEDPGRHGFVQGGEQEGASGRDLVQNALVEL